MAKIKKLTKRKRPTVDDTDFFLAGEPVPVPRERPYVVLGGGRSAPRRDRVVPSCVSLSLFLFSSPRLSLSLSKLLFELANSLFALFALFVSFSFSLSPISF